MHAALVRALEARIPISQLRSILLLSKLLAHGYPSQCFHQTFFAKSHGGFLGRLHICSFGVYAKSSRG